MPRGECFKKKGKKKKKKSNAVHKSLLAIEIVSTIIIPGGLRKSSRMWEFLTRYRESSDALYGGPMFICP